MKSLTLRALATLLVALPMTVAAFGQTEAPVPGLRRMPRGLTVSKIKSHVMAPANTKNIQMEEADPAKERTYKMPIESKDYKVKPTLDVAAFGAAVHSVLKDNTAGYIMQVRKNGVLIHNNIWNWAQTPADQNKGWTENTRMHVASVSKFLTAAGLVKLLDKKGISYDAKIIDYLPTYWQKGSNIDQITFRHLLKHQSGFKVPGSSTDFATMKSKVAAGVSDVGTPSGYENVNFGLMRILIPVINGDVAKNWVPVGGAGLDRDQVWDATTIGFYKDYMQDTVFTPAGVTNASFAPSANLVNAALAYPFPAGAAKGWNSGDLQTVSGGAGWRLSIKELLNVMNQFRRKNTIVTAEEVQTIFDNGFALAIIPTPAGNLYAKSGGWGIGGSAEHCVAFFFPDGMEAVVYANSPVGTQDYSLKNVVRDAFRGSLKNWNAPTAPRVTASH